MEKLGMVREGLLRQHVKKWGQYEDVVTYGLLRQDWLQTRAEIDLTDNLINVQ